MRRRRASLLLAGAALVAALALVSGALEAAPALPLDEAVARIRAAGSLDAEKARDLADAIEPAVAATGDEDAVRIVRELRDADSDARRAKAKQELAAHLESLAFLRTEGLDVRHDAAMLERILDEEGLGASGPQDVLRRLQELVLAYLEKIMATMFGSEAAATGAKAAYYVVMAASALVAGWLMWRALSMLLVGKAPGKRGPSGESADGGEPAVEAARGLPGDVLAFADSEAEAGRFREAVRALFGGAARTLVDSGCVPRAKTRTTLEMLRETRERAPSLEPPLAALASIFEPAWYGHVDPGQDGFAQARRAYLSIESAAGTGGASA